MDLNSYKHLKISSWFWLVYILGQGFIQIQIPLYASALFFPPTNVPKPMDGIFAPDRSTNEFISDFSENTPR